MSTRKNLGARKGNPTNTNVDGPSTGQPRITPRNSNTERSMTKETPYGTLRQLANLPKPSTPLRRASSVGPPSTHRSIYRTPATQSRSPGAAQRLGGPAKRANGLTPHGRAAIREVEARRAGLTPAKDRRRSGRQQRETPRDVLRLLSRTLAPKTQPIVATPQGQHEPKGRFILPLQDDDDEPDPERPRLSMPLEEDEDDSLLLPPQSAGLEDDNFTVQSVELPRRAAREQPDRLSRGSFGSIRTSDRFADLNDMGLGQHIFDSSFVGPGDFDDDDDELPDMAEMAAFQGENNANLRDFGRISFASGRSSDIRRLDLAADDTETTFVFGGIEEDEPLRESFGNRQISSVGEDYGVDENPTEPEDVEVETNLQGIGIEASVAEIRRAPKKKIKYSKYGIQYPSLPVGVVKKLATTYARTAGNSKAKFGKDTLDAIQQASDWFFEQVSDDLGAYSKHAGRKTIDESDILTLMKRQRQTNSVTTPFSLAQRHLPRELLQELRMAPPSKFKRGRQLDKVEEANDE
ncbi:hypothetical protein B7494_g8185 [Chlorociboria aeruginascens]|nr:hypothetical protein B7494_g8185 [Chlorociboria aeruginascens]